MPNIVINQQNLIDQSHLIGHIARIEVFIKSKDEISDPKAKPELLFNIWTIRDINFKFIKYHYFQYVSVDIPTGTFTINSDKNNELNSAPNKKQAMLEISKILKKLNS